MLLKPVAGALLGLSALLGPNQARAATCNIDLDKPEIWNYSTIHAALDDKQYDVYNWIGKEFTMPDNPPPEIGGYFDLRAGSEGKPITYTFNNVTINERFEGGTVFGITHGGYITFSGTLTLKNSGIGITNGLVMSGTSYSNIEIRDVTFENIKYGIWMDDIPRIDIKTSGSAAVSISNCTANKGEKFVAFNSGDPPTLKSPYASVIGCNVIDIRGNFGAIDTPKVETSPGNFILLGNDDIKGNYLIGTFALSNPNLYQYYNSPSGNVYAPITLENSTTLSPSFKPFMEGYYNSAGELIKPLVPGFYDNLTNKNYIANFGDANLDGIVDMKDYVTWFSNYGRTEGTNWGTADFNNNGIVDMADYVIWFDNYGKTVSGTSLPDGIPSGSSVPEPATLSLIGLTGLPLLKKRRE